MDVSVAVAFEGLYGGIEVGRFGVVDPESAVGVVALLLSVGISLEGVEQGVVGLVEEDFGHRKSKERILEECPFVVKL